MPEEAIPVRHPNIFSTYKILEATNPSEYSVLTDGQKDAYRMIISCGQVRIEEDDIILTKLFTLFGEGTETRAALIELTGVTP